MNEDELILEWARSVRPHLKHLPYSSAADLDQSLADVLNSKDKRSAADRILVILEYDTYLRSRFAEALASGDLEGVQRSVSRLSPLPGHGNPVKPTRFACPRGDFVWYRRKVGEHMPRCATHDVELVHSPLGE